MSNQADFYILQSSSEMARLNFACRVLEKAYDRNNKTLVYLENQAQLNKLDSLLWSFRDISFIPHAKEATFEDNTLIALSLNLSFKRNVDIMLNLSEKMLPEYKNFPRIIEIISNEPQIKQKGRDRYIFYRDAQFILKTHEISS
jgi:DNA polymerase III subunit chi